MFERFTEQCQRAVVLAQAEAGQLNHDHVGTEHVLAGLLREDSGAAAGVLEASGVTLDAVRQQIVALAGPGQRPPSGHVPFTPRARKSFELALREAVGRGRHIGTGHLLLGLIGQQDSVAVQILAALGVDLEAFRAQVVRETESRPEGLEFTPPLRVRPQPRQTAPPDPVQELLDAIDDRLSAIERHLGMESGGGENVIPPS